MRSALRLWSLGAVAAAVLASGCQKEPPPTTEQSLQQNLPVAAAEIQGDLTYQDVLQKGEVVHTIGLPGEANQIWVGTHRGLFVSAGNKTWALLSPELEGDDITGWYVDPDDVNRIFVGGRGVAKYSVNGGRNWEDIDGLPAGAEILNLTGTVIDDQPTLLALIAGEGIYRSADGGQRWKKWLATEPDMHAMDYSRQEQVLYALKQDTVYTHDGASWIREELPDRPQVYSLSVDKGTGDLFAATSKGIMRKREGEWEVLADEAPERLVLIAAGAGQLPLLGVGESAFIYVLQQEGWVKWQ